MSNELVKPEVKQAKLVEFSPEEMDERIQSVLYEWVDSDHKLDPVVKEALIGRTSQLRLKIQTVFAEVQKKIVKELLIDVEFEAELRREMRLNLPYMSALERINTLKALEGTYRDRLERLERQMAGFDLFSNIEFALQALTEMKVPLDLAEKVKELTPAKRRNLLNIIDDLKIEIEQAEKSKDVSDSTTEP
jgi:hypothetical protein